MKKLIEEGIDDRDETSSDSEETIHHIREMKKIEEKKKHYTATVKINGKKKEIKIDTGSPKTIMPPDETMLELTGIQKITNRFQDVNKSEKKFQAKFPVNVEYENNKRKMDILLTEGTDITSLLGMDWMEKFTLTNGKIQLGETNQSEREKVFNKFTDLFENNETINDTEINNQLKPGHYPVKQKARPVPLHLQEDVKRE